jgi:ADP-ribose pyrophosphatase YjhB (NUDIX family)
MAHDHLLMINHRGIREGDFWTPPGGGLQFGETLENCLKREFSEETGLDIEIKEFRFLYEFVQLPLHAIELYFLIDAWQGELNRGTDPEMEEKQIIHEVKFMSWSEIDRLTPVSRHGIFNFVSESSKIVHLKGHFKL